MSKKPKLRKRWAYQVVKDAIPLYDSQEIADREVFAGWWSQKIRSTFDPALAVGDVFIVFSVKHNGSGRAFLKILPPSGKISWIALSDRSNIKKIYEPAKKTQTDNSVGFTG